MLTANNNSVSLKKGLISLLVVLSVMIIGAVGMRHFEKISWLDSIFFMCMMASAQGPTFTPVTSGGKIFASVISFLSVGSVVAASTFLFGPFFMQLWKIGLVKVEEEIHHVNKDGHKEGHKGEDRNVYTRK